MSQCLFTYLLLSLKGLRQQNIIFFLVLFKDFCCEVLSLSHPRYAFTVKTNSEVIGADLTTYEAFTEYTITVLAKDSAGAYLTTGGDGVHIWIQNECTFESVEV